MIGFTIMRILLFVFLSCVIVSRAEITEPCLAVKIPLEERISASQAIIHGRVVAQRAVWDDAERSIYTLNTVVVHDVWKGAADIGDTIRVLTEGGDMGTFGRTVIGTLKLSIGDVGYLLLEHPRDRDVTFSRANTATFYRPYAETQALLITHDSYQLVDCWGKIGITAAQFEGTILHDMHHRIVSRRPEEPHINRQTGKPVDMVQKATMVTDKIIGGAGQPVTIRGIGFGPERGTNYVTFTSDGTNYHSAEYARTFVYRKWTDDEIIVEAPPSYSGKVRVVLGDKICESMNVLHVTSNLAARTLSPLSYTNHVNTNGKGGYTWNLDKVLHDNPEARTCVESVMRQFRCKTGMSFDVAPEGTTAGYKLNDGVNAIIFDAPGYELGAGAVAYCDWIWYSCIVGNETFYYIRDTDCRLSAKFNWYYGNGKNPEFGMAKLRYVLYHEIGHAHQFGHVNEPGESMHPVVQALPAEEWLQRDTITESEQRAGWFMTRNGRDFSFRGCGITPLTPPNTDDCNSDVTSDVADICAASHAIVVTPNPVLDVINVLLSSPADPGSMVSIIDMLGVVRATQTVALGSSRLSLPVASLPAGRYTIVYQHHSGSQSVAGVIVE